MNVHLPADASAIKYSSASAAAFRSQYEQRRLSRAAQRLNIKTQWKRRRTRSRFELDAFVPGFAQRSDRLHHSAFAGGRSGAETIVQEVAKPQRSVRELDVVTVREGQQVGLRRGETRSTVERDSSHALEIGYGPAHRPHRRLDAFKTRVALLDAEVGVSPCGRLEGVAAREVRRDADRSAAAYERDARELLVRMPRAPCRPTCRSRYQILSSRFRSERLHLQSCRPESGEDHTGFATFQIAPYCTRRTAWSAGPST